MCAHAHICLLTFNHWNKPDWGPSFFTQRKDLFRILGCLELSAPFLSPRFSMTHWEGRQGTSSPLGTYCYVQWHYGDQRGLDNDCVGLFEHWSFSLALRNCLLQPPSSSPFQYIPKIHIATIQMCLQFIFIWTQVITSFVSFINTLDHRYLQDWL